MTTRAASLLIVLGATAGCPDGNPPAMESLGDASEASGPGVDSDTGAAMPDQGPGSGTDGSTEETDTELDTTTGEPPHDTMFEVSLSQVKQFDFSWSAFEGAAFYQLLERLDESDSFVQVSNDIDGLQTSLTVPLHFRSNASYMLRACNEGGCTDSQPLTVMGPLAEAIGYFKASNGEADDFMGYAIAISDDGATLVVGAPHEDSAAAGVGGDQASNSAPNAGAVYVFIRDGKDEWTQQAYIKPSNTDAGDDFGRSVALSADGNTLAVGARLEDSNSAGIHHVGDLNSIGQFDNSMPDSGAAYVFVRDNTATWTRQAYIKASNVGQGDYFGGSVALAADGKTLAVGSVQEDSSAAGINGDQANNAATDAGAVYVYARGQQGLWSQEAYAKASNPGESDYFGHSLSLSADGSVLAIGATHEDSAAVLIGGDQSDESAENSGAVYVLVRSKQIGWMQQAYIKPVNTEAADFFASSLALSGDGQTLVVGAAYEDSGSMGIGADPIDNSAVDSGAVHVYMRNGQNGWWQQAYIKPSNTGAGDTFGSSLALSDDGATLVIGATDEDSDAIGVEGDPTDESVAAAGAAYVFVRDEQDEWWQHAYIKAPNPDANDRFGFHTALSGDGTTMAISSFMEASDATGIGGDATDNSAPSAGAVYVY